MAIAIVQALVGAFFLGLVYALIASGLSLIWGTMDIINFAYGEFLMLSMYTSFWLYQSYGVDPMNSLPFVAVLFYGGGVMVYRLVVKRILGAPPLVQIFATFGLSIALQNLALFLWAPAYRLMGKTVLTGQVGLGPIVLDRPQLVAALGAILTLSFLHWLLNFTQIGNALRATAEDREAAELMGVDTNRAFSIAWGLSGAASGIAGVFLSTYFPVFPWVGTVFLVTAFATVALGGLGSVFGVVAAGLTIAVIEGASGLFWVPAYKHAVVFVLFIVLLVIRPEGLFGGVRNRA